MVQKKKAKDIQEQQPDAVEPLQDELIEIPGEDIEHVEVIEARSTNLDQWVPKTKLGKEVKAGLQKSIDPILERGEAILEAEIVDYLIPTLKSELLLVGQAKGKFGGGQRRVFKQTQKKTQEGNKPKFTTFAVVGDKEGHVGIGKGKAKETVPAREKALRNAKLNIMKIRRGCGSWQCNCKTPHSIPFIVTGKMGSVELTLIPAPKGTGLRVEKECQKLLDLAGIKDVWSKVKGQTGTKQNLLLACFAALQSLTHVKLTQKEKELLAVTEGVYQFSSDESFDAMQRGDL
ncbi:MAG: 30S ribosomal protein S5 [Candidatus Woesearchaeota archaeon]